MFDIYCRVQYALPFVKIRAQAFPADSDIKDSRALPVSSAILFTKGFLCEGIVFTGDEVHKLTLEDNSFINNFRDFQIFGQGDKVKFSDNDVTHVNAGLPILLLGEAGICSNGTEFIPLEIGVPEHTNINGNRIRRGGSGIAVLTLETEFTTFAQNDVTGATFGLILLDGFFLHAGRRWRKQSRTNPQRWASQLRVDDLCRSQEHVVCGSRQG